MSYLLEDLFSSVLLIASDSYLIILLISSYSSISFILALSFISSNINNPLFSTYILAGILSSSSMYIATAYNYTAET